MQNTKSPTIQNLEAAFAGESMAHIKYMWFARQCRKAGDEATARVFEDTAAQEMLHAFGHAELLFADKYNRDRPDARRFTWSQSDLVRMQFRLVTEDSPEMATILGRRTPVGLLDRPWNRALPPLPAGSPAVVRCSDWDGGAHRDPQAMAEALKAAILRHLGEVEQWPEEQLLERRHARLQAQGVYRAS